MRRHGDPGALNEGSDRCGTRDEERCRRWSSGCVTERGYDAAALDRLAFWVEWLADKELSETTPPPSTMSTPRWFTSRSAVGCNRCEEKHRGRQSPPSWIGATLNRAISQLQGLFRYARRLLPSVKRRPCSTLVTVPRVLRYTQIDVDDKRRVVGRVVS